MLQCESVNCILIDNSGDSSEYAMQKSADMQKGK